MIPLYIMCCFCSWCFEDLFSIFGFQPFDQDVPDYGFCFFYLMSFGRALFINFWVFKSKFGKYFCHFLLNLFSLIFWDPNYTYFGAWYLYKMFCYVFYFQSFFLSMLHIGQLLLIFAFTDSIISIQLLSPFSEFLISGIVFFKFWNFILFVFISLLKLSIFLIHWAHILFYFIETN